MRNHTGNGEITILTTKGREAWTMVAVGGCHFGRSEKAFQRDWIFGCSLKEE